MKKTFQNYCEAYVFYGDIVSGRESDKKNASIVFIDKGEKSGFTVEWEEILPIDK